MSTESESRQAIQHLRKYSQSISFEFELDKLQALITRREVDAAVVAELKAVLSNVPMPTLSYEQIENRIAAIAKHQEGKL